MNNKLWSGFKCGLGRHPFLFDLYLLVIKQKDGMSKTHFRQDMKRYSRMLNDGSSFPISAQDIRPILSDIRQNAGAVDGHYFLQDIYFARKIHEERPIEHYDIGSRMDGFIAHLLSAGLIKKIIQLDIRPFQIKVEGLEFIQTDATYLRGIKDGSLPSISSLHVVEHFGLGRYGDPIDPLAWKKALQSIQRKTAKSGYFYFGCPVGRKEKLCFNAHRIFSPATIVKTLDKMEIISFAYIHNNTIIEVPVQDIGSCVGSLGEYDCGLFVFRKL